LSVAWYVDRLLEARLEVLRRGDVGVVVRLTLERWLLLVGRSVDAIAPGDLGYWMLEASLIYRPTIALNHLPRLVVDI
jgi:hypothetical protein